jgi:putative transposase
MILNECGQIAHDEWLKLSERFPNMELDVFQIMPNHMHGIIILNNPIVGAGFTPAQNNQNNQNKQIIQNDSDKHNITDFDNRAHGDDQNWATVEDQQRAHGDDQQRATLDDQKRATVDDQNRAHGDDQNRAHGDDQNRATARVAPTVSDIVGAYKSLVANICLDIYKSKYVMAGFTPDQIPMFGKLWQRNYYEHIIRNEQSYQSISEYIINNPGKWQEDKFYENGI